MLYEKDCKFDNDYQSLSDIFHLLKMIRFYFSTCKIIYHLDKTYILFFFRYKFIINKYIVGGKNCVLRTKLCFLDEYSIFFNKSYI